MSATDNKKSSKKVTLIVLIVVIAVLVVTAFIVFKKGSEPGGFPPMGMEQEGNTVTVRTQVLKTETLHDYVNTNGEIETQSSVEVFPSVGGKITDVNVSLGSNVKAGDILAYVDPSEPGSEYAKSGIIAPISGTITKSPLKKGTKVSSSSTFTVIGDVANLQITASVPEKYVATLRPGLKANIILEAYQGEVFSATVTTVSPVVDSSSRTKEVILNFDRKDQRINAGMFAKVKLYTQDYAGYPVVPDDCIIEKNNKKYIYVVSEDGSSVNQIEVTVGSSVDNTIQVLSGVTDGERVVIEGMRILSDGAKINDISQHTGENDA